MLNQVIAQVTAQIEERSYDDRLSYLAMLSEQEKLGSSWQYMPDSNLAHASAGADIQDRMAVAFGTKPNIAIISAYSDVVSGHCPYKHMPELLKAAVRKINATAQVAGSVPAVCSGIVQGQLGAELSLFSRDVTAQATALALSHNYFDAALLLGGCGDSAAGMLMGAASFAHLPVAFVPSGHMSSFFTYSERLNIQKKVKSKVLDKSALKEMEICTFHEPGMCTEFNTSNLMMIFLETMGLILPSSAFVHTGTPLRDALNEYIAQAIVPKDNLEDKHGLPTDNSKPINSSTLEAKDIQPHALCQVVTAKNLVNGMVACLSAGGAMNMVLHIIAIAKAFGYTIVWEDLEKLSAVVPLLTNMRLFSKHDAQSFHASGGTPVLLKALARHHLLHDDILTVTGEFKDQLTVPCINEHQQLYFMDCGETLNPQVLISQPDRCFASSSGLKLMQGNLGRGLVNTRTLELTHLCAPTMVFNSQHEAVDYIATNPIKQDVVIVVRGTGPAANGMPKMSKLLPVLGRLYKSGLKIALLTDGHLTESNAKFPLIMQITPEAAKGGALCALQNGDMIEVDIHKGVLNCKADLAVRQAIPFKMEHEVDCLEPLVKPNTIFGRRLFKVMREQTSSSEEGATSLF